MSQTVGNKERRMTDQPGSLMNKGSMTTEQAVLALRADPAYQALVTDSYLGSDVVDSARRFFESAEFAEVRSLLGSRLPGASVLDLGAGIGLASLAFVRCGAGRVVAVDPDPSDEIGRGAMRKLAPHGEFEIVDAVGESIPLPDDSMDLVYCRQVLHHARDLPGVLRECARVVKVGGVVLMCREHVVDDDDQLRQFLEQHDVNRLAGGESAHPLAEYLGAITDAGLDLDRVLGPWDSVINAFPQVRTEEELKGLPEAKLVRRIGRLGHLAIHVPGARALIWRRIDRPIPGRMYSFLAHRPE